MIAPAESAVAEASQSLEAILKETPDDEFYRALGRWGTAPPGGVFVVGPGVAHDDEAILRLYDSSDAPGYRWPHLARLKYADGRWRLQSILCQCTSCFGTGLVEPDDTPCGTCLARGWGVIGSTEYSLVATASPAPGSAR